MKRPVYQNMLIFPSEQVIEVFTLGPNGRYGEPEVLSHPGAEWEISTVPGVKIAYSSLFGVTEAD
jgi:hypothetical protein